MWNVCQSHDNMHLVNPHKKTRKLKSICNFFLIKCFLLYKSLHSCQICSITISSFFLFARKSTWLQAFIFCTLPPHTLLFTCKFCYCWLGHVKEQTWQQYHCYANHGWKHRSCLMTVCGVLGDPVRATLWWSHSRQESHFIERGSWLI